jgi:RNA polymerase sigma-70 factor, ECF subfamily
MCHVDDRSLVAAIAVGDQDAFRVLVERESAAVYRTCFRVLGRVHDAEDAAQETFVIAYRAIGSYRGEGSLAAWLARIAARNALRRSAQRREAAWLDPLAPGGLDVPSPSDPLAEALTAERRDGIRSTVRGLPEPYREVVALRFFADLPLADIASVTGRPLGTIKTHLRRGLARMRADLERQGDG